MSGLQKIKETKNAFHYDGLEERRRQATIEQCKSVVEGRIAPFNIGNVEISREKAAAIVSGSERRIKKYPGLLEAIQ